ncbi:Toxin coregulated pilus biosynthesis protein E [Pandoraea anapnoica]|uniref:Toxin coregulated pilus biosynthesis protein E n=1 Tax=Pandoraea anapnoica TaxID=2508301 RepID=A0A5E5AN79_9BURK|nr:MULTISPECIES: type II secretion system F family protein [Pandoraea]VVE58364.1 Toxin coregulated pilus biosynthesis protein E [Pandoraea iniqua]VVE75231.1 Toxin coregulated pilus biosynthesis protein E [Pandoraea anapnoica]
MDLNEYVERANRWFAKAQFGVAARIKFYENLVMMIENRVMLVDALREMYNIASKDGKNPMNGFAVILDSCHQAVNHGSTLAEGLKPWVSPNEVAVIAAGEQSGDLGSAFGDAIAMIDSGRKIRGALLGASLYPMVLVIMLCVLLNIVAGSLVPKLASVSNPENWQGAAYILYLMAEFVTHYGLWTVLVLSTLLCLIVISLPLLGGRARILLDRFPPWALYRTIHGSIFMLNVALLIRSGMMLQSSLELLYQRAGSRWLKDRVGATLTKIAAGADFGSALQETGYNFPDPEAIAYLRLLSRLQGFDQAMARFARHWLDETILKVQGAARGFLLASIILMGGMLTLTVTAVSGIESAIEQSAAANK